MCSPLLLLLLLVLVLVLLDADPFLEPFVDPPSRSSDFACANNASTPGKGYNCTDFSNSLTARANCRCRRASAPISRQRSASPLLTFAKSWQFRERSLFSASSKSTYFHSELAREAIQSFTSVVVVARMKQVRTTVVGCKIVPRRMHCDSR